MINLRILSGELLNQGERNRAERFVSRFFCLRGFICGLFCDLLANINYLIARSALSTPAQSKIEFMGHIIENSTQIVGVESWHRVL